TELKAYIASNLFSEKKLAEFLEGYQLQYAIQVIAQQNWNQVWESHFQPITVDNFVGVRAHFHPPFTQTQYEIIITPKMSFGTGHHATTYMMMQLMQSMQFNGKSVFDYGTGTGILAILAAKLGANKILAVDYDDWCIENASENISQNRVEFIQLIKGDTAITNEQYEIVIANINKNIILDNLSHLAKAVAPNGQVLLSGLLVEDAVDIIHATQKLGWKHLQTIQKGIWIALQFAA
ncbi:MAG: 50S ribosomal protein L11 methyltransferase, partial [Chitinophagaceae bacterium]